MGCWKQLQFDINNFKILGSTGSKTIKTAGVLWGDRPRKVLFFSPFFLDWFDALLQMAAEVLNSPVKCCTVICTNGHCYACRTSIFTETFLLEVAEDLRCFWQNPLLKNWIFCRIWLASGIKKSLISCSHWGFNLFSEITDYHDFYCGCQW